MNKLKLESPDLVGRNIDALAELFPNCVTEAAGADGKVKRAVNFELLRQMLSGDAVEGEEHYEFTWVGKNKAIAEAHKPIRKTLRPCPSESKNWDTTENLYIEGDNLEVLKLLQENYLGKVKMIYIDPPYNTGNDFIYRDDFAVSAEDYQEQMGMFDEEDNRLFKNTDSNGRFHSDWCSMMYSRLLLARNLLRNDGFIFISIDDNELSNLKKICDDVFGPSNFRGQISRATGTPTGQGTANLVTEADYILLYSKSAECALYGMPFSSEDERIYNLQDEYGRYLNRPLRKTGGEDRREDRPSMYYPVYSPDGTPVYPIAPSGYESRWRCAESHYKELLAGHRIDWVNDNGTWKVYQKFYLEGRTKQASNLWTDIEGNKKATITIKKILGSTVFDFPKPVELIKRIVQISTSSDDIVMDFFSGSATTAQAIMEQNNDDQGCRRFILVQLDEPCKSDSEAYKAGYKTICDVGKERIRRSGEKIKSENPLTTADLDVGFRVFKVDSSNMNNVYYAPGDYTQDLLLQMESNIKADRSDLDLLFGCLLEWNLPLSLPHSTRIIDGCTVHSYNHGDLMACFDENIPESVILSIAKEQPLRAVFRDSSFASSPEKINVYERFKMLAPDTDVRVI